MQTSLTPLSPAVRRRSPTTRLRQGCLGTHAAAHQLVQLCPPHLDRMLAAKAGVLEAAVSSELRHAVQLAMGHPTLLTLRDAFEATDAVLKFTGQVARRTSRLVDVGLQVRIHVVLAGIRAGLAELEQGLEVIQLLPTGAPDYPEED